MSIIDSLPSYTKSEPATQLKQLKLRISGRIKQGLYSKLSRYGLCRDLSLSLERPNAKIPISVRPLAKTDLDILLPMQSNGSIAEKQEISWRRDFYRKVPDGCYVAIDQRDDTPCYMQWLIGSKDNDLIASFKCFPRLKSDEALLEQAYTSPSHRGLGIMSAAMALIAEQGSNVGAHHVVTFVEEKNIASLKGCQRAGFAPYMLHRRVQMGFGTIICNSFENLAEDDPRRTLTF